MITFYYNTAPNPMKIALFLEETGLDYEPVPVDTRRGEQHAAEFLAINPNAKVPVIVDGETTVFDSNAILLYLAEMTGRFLPPEGPGTRGDLLSWLMFVASGVGPFSGQAVHFRNNAPEKIPYALKRYDFEARRHWQIVEDRLADHPYMLGGAYSIVDMAVWGWASRLTYMLGDDRIMETYPNIARLLGEIDARPAAERAHALAGSHPFKTEFDDEAIREGGDQAVAPSIPRSSRRTPTDPRPVRRRPCRSACEQAVRDRTRRRAPVRRGRRPVSRARGSTPAVCRRPQPELRRQGVGSSGDGREC